MGWQMLSWPDTVFVSRENHVQMRSEKMKVVINNPKSSDVWRDTWIIKKDDLYWSNTMGWVARELATVYLGKTDTPPKHSLSCTWEKYTTTTVSQKGYRS